MRKMTAEYVRGIIKYDPEHGAFYWKQRHDVPPMVNAVLANRPAGFRREDGRLMITIRYKHYIAARLAWLIMTGAWPKREIDHQDTNRANDTWNNLREATESQNQHNKKTPKNNTSGVKGVSWCQDRRKWLAQICVNGKSKNLGRYNTIEEAQAVYRHASVDLHREFSRVA